MNIRQRLTACFVAAGMVLAAIDSPLATAAVSGSSSASDPAKKETTSEQLLKDATAVKGVIPLYRKGNRLLAELGPPQLNEEFIVLISIARGIGKVPLLGGMTWTLEDDDWVWKFRKIEDRIQIVRRNVRFHADRGTPEAAALKHAFTDSVLFSLKILGKGPQGGDLVDLTPVFMSDLPEISHVLSGFAFSADRSTWAAVKGFENNVEIEVAATYASSGRSKIETVADTRGATIHVHYSISKLQAASYQPRLADDRVGYFVTAVKDFSKQDGDDQFVRYINRWNLQKADAKAKQSPPREPLVFWIENTVPFRYRPAVRAGILAWNKAFEAAGIANAIEVRQQPDDATWDPEDINYNVFRWMTANAGFAMGPSRVNPYTGQILDADIIFDADFVQSWARQIETFTPDDVAAMTGGPLDLQSYTEHQHGATAPCGHRECRLNQSLTRQMALAQLALSNGAAAAKLEDLQEQVIMQGLKEVVMHEVGHTLGLRHNFKASTFYSLEALENPAAEAQTGLAASVMDYLPINIVPHGKKQGAYFSTTIGPYDVWAIQYGYTPLSGGTKGELAELEKIASRSGGPGLAYATDEDTRGIDPDPDANRFDLGKDTIAFARQRAKLVEQLLPKLVDRVTKPGTGYQRVRETWNTLLSTYGRAMHFASRYVGGVRLSRSHRGDKDAPPPAVVVPPETQRQALALLEASIFGAKPFDFPPELFSQMSGSHWSHWGADVPDRPDYPLQETIRMWQNRIMEQLFSPLTLQRVSDNEAKTPADQDAFTVAELISRTTRAIFSEVDTIKAGKYTTRQPAIGGLRRNLQRSYLKRLSDIVLNRAGVPDDAATVAAAELSALQAKITALLARNVELDAYSKAHLQDTARRIEKILDARFTLKT